MTDHGVSDPDQLASLERALQRDFIAPWFQPAMDPTGVQMLTVEALPRLVDPDFGIVAPDRFLTAAKESGLLSAVGEVLLRKTCSAYADWATRQIAPPQVSINLTGDELRAPGLAAALRGAVQEASIDANALAIELTEDCAEDQVVEASVDALVEIRALGVDVIIDDLASLAVPRENLARLRACAAKLSRKMVAAIDTDVDGVASIDAAIELAKAMRLPVIAKGVETRNQIDVLTRLGCEGQQGYAIARPMPLDSFTEWLDLNTGWDLSAEA